MDKTNNAAKAAELRRRRILGSEADRMEKLTGHKQPQHNVSNPVNFGMENIDFDALKKNLPLIKLKVKCALKLTFLLSISLLGAITKLCESDSKFLPFKILRFFTRIFLSIPPLPFISKFWENNHLFRAKFVKILTWTSIITFMLIKAPPPNIDGANDKSNAKDSSNLANNENEFLELFTIPQEFKDLLSTIGEWSCAVLLFFFIGYDISHNFIV